MTTVSAFGAIAKRYHHTAYDHILRTTSINMCN